MKNILKSSLTALLTFGLAMLLSGCDLILIDSKGSIGLQERNLIITATILMLIVVVPVFIMTAIFAWRYRASNKHANYDPNWSHSARLEAIVWTIPSIIIVVLATITWYTTHSLDPYKPLDSKTKPINIEVIALNWKWLFIYPDYNIATVNYVAFPANTPVNFKLTSDAPMNSFMIPQLGGQIYTMNGMQTKLHLIANEVGDYAGMSANYSGSGFSDMRFVAHVTTDDDFVSWVNTVKKSSVHLTVDVYKDLAKPSNKNPVMYYSSVRERLFDSVMMKYMMPGMDSMELMPFNMNAVPDMKVDKSACTDK